MRTDDDTDLYRKLVIFQPNATWKALRFRRDRKISEWVVSVERRSPYLGPLFGLYDAAEDLRLIGVDGLAPDFLFGSYRQDQARFSCLLRDEWEVATLMRIVGHEA
jgi:hypothetical protein